uniref:WAPL domain-containing protein n=1 Tax=Mesocestoides corti TaxID=53468 RepID=A0A5K3FS00_MESCO
MKISDPADRHLDTICSSTVPEAMRSPESNFEKKRFSIGPATPVLAYTLTSLSLLQVNEKLRSDEFSVSVHTLMDLLLRASHAFQNESLHQTSTYFGFLALAFNLIAAFE